jgi:hypothetical protein
MGLGAVSSNDGLKQAATSLDDAMLDDARLGFHCAHSQRSARRVFYFTQIFAFGLFAAGLVWALTHAAGTTFFALHIAALTLFTTAIAWRLVAASILTPVLSRLAEPAMANLHHPLPTLSRSPGLARSPRGD